MKNVKAHVRKARAREIWWYLHKSTPIKSQQCEACGCDPCDCDWGN